MREDDHQPYKVLVPITDAADGVQMLGLAAAILGGREGVIAAVGIIEVPPGKSFSNAANDALKLRRLLRRLTQQVETARAEMVHRVRIARTAEQALRELAEEERASLLLLPWREPWGRTDTVLRDGIEALVDHPPCDLALVKLGAAEPVQSILLAARGGPQAELGLDLGLSLTQTHGASLTLMHIDVAGTPLAEAEQEHRLFQALLARCQDSVRTRCVSTTADPDNIGGVIAREAEKHQLIILGAAVQGRKGATSFGAIPESVALQTGASVLIVKSRQPVDPGIFRPTPPPVDVLVDRWFAENTFHCREFTDLDELLEAKARQGVRVSCALMAQGGAETLPAIIRALRSELVERHPLLDEVVLFDPAGRPDLVDLAQELGIPAYSVASILPEYSTQQDARPGEALWKSLHVLEGDLVVWLDTDIRNPHPKLVYGLLGPLLREERIQFVSGFYERPASTQDVAFEDPTVQVAELAARPLLNLFFPDLSGLVAPLSREFAGRRSALEQVPVYSGFGVEMGLLIELYQRFGLSAIAQCELEERVGREFSLAYVSRRAFAVIQAALQKVDGQAGPGLRRRLSSGMKFIHQEGDRYFLEVVNTGERELPPLISLPAYTARRPSRPVD
ncbi:MAG TPA: universal stress protein [Dehalococcoidia bacterium]